MGVVGAVNRYSAVTVSRIDGFTRIGTEEAQQQEASSGSAPLDTGPGATANTAPATGPTGEAAAAGGAGAGRLRLARRGRGRPRRRGPDVGHARAQLVHLRGLTPAAGGRLPRPRH